MLQIDLMPELANRRTFGFKDDYHWYTDLGLWTKLSADGGSSVAITTGGVGGTMTHTTGATDNNETALKTTIEQFKFAIDKPLLFEARIQYTEANTDDANVAVGFADTFGANLLVDDGAGPKTSFSGALIYKVDGGTAWKCVSSKSTTQTISTSNTTAGGSAYQTLRIEGRLAAGASTLEVCFFVGNTILIDSTTLKPIKHNVTVTSAVAMAAGTYIKAGGANSEVMLVDYCAAYQLR